MAPIDAEKYSNIVQKIESIVKEHCEHLDSAHDWDHVKRVRQLALRLYRDTCSNGYLEEELQMVELIALLHDVGDFKFGFDQEKILDEILTPLVDEATKQHIKNEVSLISWRKSLKSEKDKENHPETVESKLQLHDFVSDADRLDAMGNIGIARCFSYGGSRHSKLYDLSVDPDLNLTKESYNAQTEILQDGKVLASKSKNNSLNHFYEKLFKLKDSLKTDKGKEMGIKRHERLQCFVKEFLEEVNCES
ncbi:hypothetical protein DASC09_014480 [Saccharomycopsis crataegensis]|uniref:HD/PDEase domain-containing protein n=1 Tax=Saccharomycopsis crataegensis TaxID=43959 RepID=A0AAV5QJ00_9ASCO|nr:hypothetical protein DASC09_014480 [Saccharomycopsis crataegensis]